MKDKEVKKLSKIDMLRLLRDQEVEITQLKEENQKLRQQLQDKIIRMDQCGSIAEAALELNDIFQRAEMAANQYLESIKQKF